MASATKVSRAAADVVSSAVASASSALSTSSSSAAAATATQTLGGWSLQQRCFRNVMRSLRSAYFHDRAKLFWARHRVLVEFYKYSKIDDPQEIDLLVGIASEVAAFAAQYMNTNVERLVRHNEKTLMLPVAQAKKFRQDYFLAEKQHETWCRQRIKGMLERRPPPPYPFY